MQAPAMRQLETLTRKKAGESGLKVEKMIPFVTPMRLGIILANISTEENESIKDELRNNLRWLDVNVNINWPLMHYKSAVRYLQKDVEDIAATGGTNWQKYLPPRFQKRMFYPELWSEEEIEEWGKGWVKKVVFNIDE